MEFDEEEEASENPEDQPTLLEKPQKQIIKLNINDEDYSSQLFYVNYII